MANPKAKPEARGDGGTSNATVRATILVGGHGYAVVKLLEYTQTQAGQSIAFWYALMAIGPALGLAFAFRGLLHMGTGKPDYEFWIAFSTYLMSIIIMSAIVGPLLFWTFVGD